MALAPYPWLEKPAKTLKKLREKLPGGIILYGPRGCGAFELASNFASSVVCSSPVDGAACGKCAECILVKAGNHPDLKFVLSEAQALVHPMPWEASEKRSTKTKAATKTISKQILIEQVREIGEYLSVTSNRGGNRAVVIYPADSMGADQSSVLLKTLEEPPAGAILILVADDLQKILPTIRSRCQLIRVSPPTRDQALDYLNKNGIDNPESELARLGGMPLLIHEKDDSLVMDRLAEEQLLRLLARAHTIKVSEILDLYKSEPAVLPVVCVLQRWHWDLMSVCLGGSIRYYPEYESQIHSLAVRLSSQKLLSYEKVLKQNRASANHPLNKKLVVQDLLLQYAQIIKSATLAN